MAPHVEDAVVDRDHDPHEERDAEGSVAEIEEEDVLLAILVEALRNGRGVRLVNDAHDVEPGYGAGALGGLVLGVFEVGRHCYNSVPDVLSEALLSSLFLHLKCLFN